MIRFGFATVAGQGFLRLVHSSKPGARPAPLPELCVNLEAVSEPEFRWQSRRIARAPACYHSPKVGSETASSFSPVPSEGKLSAISGEMLPAELVVHAVVAAFQQREVALGRVAVHVQAGLVDPQ